jgi:hypothetical protein
MDRSEKLSPEAFARECETFAAALRTPARERGARNRNVHQWAGVFLAHLSDLRCGRSAASSKDAAPRPCLRVMGRDYQKQATGRGEE